MPATITLDDARLIAEQVADVLHERGLLQPAAGSARVLDVAQVAELLGRSTDWVYEHARELGAFRMGDGARAPLGFDIAEIDAWKRAHSLRPDPPPDVPRARRRGRAARPTGEAPLIDYEEQP